MDDTRVGLVVVACLAVAWLVLVWLLVRIERHARQMAAYVRELRELRERRRLLQYRAGLQARCDRLTSAAFPDVGEIPEEPEQRRLTGEAARLEREIAGLDRRLRRLDRRLGLSLDWDDEPEDATRA